MSYARCTRLLFKSFISCPLVWQTFYADAAAADGLLLERTDAATFGVRVLFVANWVGYMVALYEWRSACCVIDTVYFKLSIDSCCHWNCGGHVFLFLGVLLGGLCSPRGSVSTPCPFYHYYFIIAMSLAIDVLLMCVVLFVLC